MEATRDVIVHVKAVVELVHRVLGIDAVAPEGKILFPDPEWGYGTIELWNDDLVCVEPFEGISDQVEGEFVFKHELSNLESIVLTTHQGEWLALVRQDDDMFVLAHSGGQSFGSAVRAAAAASAV
jgi:hypothetical protein